MITHMVISEQLDERFATFLELLNKLANDQSPSAVHHARIASRRLETALYLFKGVVPKETYRLYKGVCAGLRAESNPIRDMDITLENPQGMSPKLVEKTILKRRMKVRKLREWVLRWNQSLGDVTQSQLQNRNFARQRIALRLIRLYGKFLSYITLHSTDSKKCHRWRIATKRLRYALEMIHDPQSQEILQNALDALVAIQNAMGAINDQKTRLALQKTKTDSLLPPSAHPITFNLIYELNRIAHGIDRAFCVCLLEVPNCPAPSC